MLRESPLGKFIVTAAGGNATAIEVLDRALSRTEYEDRGKELMAETEGLGAEQCGFLVLSDHHFEMSGGEFCGNASRSAALLFSKLSNERAVSFTVSGFAGTVSATVEHREENRFFVECRFPGMPTATKDVVLAGNQAATVVDLGGIVHIVIEAPFPEDYKPLHHAITHELGLEGRDAVGVVWISRTPGAVAMHPVVWVRAINTFFYESSCGSGTIAVGKVTGVPSIVQPTGQVIQAEVTADAVILRSEMELVREVSHE